MPDGQPTFSVATKFGFDRAGPTLGSVQLLENTRLGFAPLPLDTIEQRLARAFHGAFDCANWSEGLGAISRAMNDGDLAKAAILTQYLSRPRFVAYAEIAKASPEDPDHPGWPKGAPDGKGGEFRPLDGAGDAPRVDPKQERIDRLKARRQFREILKRVLTKGRVLRLLGEVVGDAIPFDVVAEAATIADLYLLARYISIES